jgi:hypothetical protein
MDSKSPHEDPKAVAGRGEAARDLVGAVEAALADLKRQIPGGLSPLELVEEQRIQQAARRLLECAEELADGELLVRGSMKQVRPHPLLKVEQELRREVADSLRKLTFAALNRASYERIQAFTTGKRS